MSLPIIKRKRGRPSREAAQQHDVRQRILRTGVEVLTETGYSASGLDALLKRAQVPKGSFYHYFDSKEAFGLAVLDHYDSFFVHLLNRTLNDGALPPLERIAAFVDAAAAGMEKYQFRRGCAVGNLAQEVALLPESFRQRLLSILEKWQQMMTACLQDAVADGSLAASANCPVLAQFFWTGWEGAVLRAKLSQQRAPLDLFLHCFLAGLPGSHR